MGDFEPDQVLLHRREPGRLVRVRARTPTSAYVMRINAAGVRKAGAKRLSRIRLDRLVADYQPYKPCRWSLDCLVQMTTTVTHTQWGAIAACDEHAKAHRAWAAANAGRWHNIDPEPEPDCWCPDSHRNNGMTVPYCPVHGTPAERGTEIA